MGAEAGNGAAAFPGAEEPVKNSVAPELAPDDIRAVLAAAADVVFSDGVAPEFLDHWAAETSFVLQARRESELRAHHRRHGSSGYSNR
jgi:hypothetical protein